MEERKNFWDDAAIRDSYTKKMQSDPQTREIERLYNPNGDDRIKGIRTLYNSKNKPVNALESYIEETFLLLEEIINEVSVGKLYDAAKNSLPKREQGTDKSFRNDLKDFSKKLERKKHAEKVVKGLEGIGKAEAHIKYEANANDFVKKLDRINRKKKEKEQKEWAGTFPERKETSRVYQQEISSDDGSEVGNTAMELKKEKYKDYIKPIKNK